MSHQCANDVSATGVSHDPATIKSGTVPRHLAILDRLGYELQHDSNILDFGCGSGATVYSFLEHGFKRVTGFDTNDYLELRAPQDIDRFKIGLEDGRLPFDDESFDLVISEEVFEHVHDQIPMWRELYRVMKPGSISIHVFPAPYCLIEPHNYVPLGGVLRLYWWYKVWAVLGIRNEYQQELTATQTARRNTLRIVENLNYVNNSCYRIIWEELGFDWRWIDQEAYDTNPRRIVRWAGKINRIIPLIGWAQRTFLTRRVMLRR